MTMFGFLAETSIHCGAGRSAGIIDLPVAREAATDYPFIAGSGLKGALRDRAESLGRSDVAKLFGNPDQAGRLLVSDARLLLLPVLGLIDRPLHVHVTDFDVCRRQEAQEKCRHMRSQLARW